jgi:transposase
MLINERTTVGLDVHARSVVAEAIGWDTGQVFTQRLVPASDEVLAWVSQLPGPVAVTHEAGPTSFGLARAKPSTRPGDGPWSCRRQTIGSSCRRGDTGWQ